MRRCPKDVSPRDFKEMLRVAPKGAVLFKSTRARSPYSPFLPSYIRTFWFRLDRPFRNQKRGDYYLMDCVVRFEKQR